MASELSYDVKIEAVEGQPVILQDSNLLSSAEFLRNGADLYLLSPGGETVMIEGYFNHSPSPDIATESGATLSPEMVAAFLPPMHPGVFAETSGPTTDASPAGKVTQVHGDAVIIHADGTKSEAEVGMAVYPGDIVQTSADGAVSLLFSDNSSFAISESARLSIDEYTHNAADNTGSTFFSMLQGVFIYTSGLIGKEDPSSVNIETPVGSIGIRGTVVAGTIAPTGSESTVTVLDGAAVITNSGGTLVLNSSFQTASMFSTSHAPRDMGRMDASDFAHSYHSVSSISTDTFTTFGVSGPTPSQQTAPTIDTQPSGTPDAPPAQNLDGSSSGSLTPQQGSTTTAASSGTVFESPSAPLSPTNFGEVTTATSSLVPTGTGTANSAPPTPTNFSTAGTTTFKDPVSTQSTSGTTAGGTTSTIADTTTTASGNNTGSGTNAAGSNGSTAPLLPTPSVNFQFYNVYTQGTTTIADDGLSILGLGLGTGPIALGQVMGTNMPTGVTYDITGLMNNWTLRYASAAGNNTSILADQPVFSFDDATNELLLINPMGLLPEFTPGFAGGTPGFNFTITATSSSGTVLAVQNFVVLFDDPDIAVTNAKFNVVVGDRNGTDMNINNTAATNDLSLDTSGVYGTADIIVGRDGNDIIYGSGGADTLLGGNGNDSFYVSDGAFHHIDGGAGTDTLYLGDGGFYTTTGFILNMTAAGAPQIKGIEQINLGRAPDGTGSDIVLDAQAIFNITDAPGSTHTLTIFSDGAANTGSSIVDVVTAGASALTLDASTPMGGGSVTYTGVANGQTVTLIITAGGSQVNTSATGTGDVVVI